MQWIRFYLWLFLLATSPSWSFILTKSPTKEGPHQLVFALRDHSLLEGFEVEKLSLGLWYSEYVGNGIDLGLGFRGTLNWSLGADLGIRMMGPVTPTFQTGIGIIAHYDYPGFAESTSPYGLVRLELMLPFVWDFLEEQGSVWLKPNAQVGLKSSHPLYKDLLLGNQYAAAIELGTLWRFGTPLIFITLEGGFLRDFSHLYAAALLGVGFEP